MNDRVAVVRVMIAEEERDHPRRSNHETTGASRYASATEQRKGTRMISPPIMTAISRISPTEMDGIHLIQSSGPLFCPSEFEIVPPEVGRRRRRKIFHL